MNPIELPCEMLTWYIFHELWYCCWLFSSNYEDPYIGSIYFRKRTITRYIVCWLGYIGHVVMLTVLVRNVNNITSWWKIYINLKYIIFDEGVVWEIKILSWKGRNTCDSNKFRTGWPYFSKFIVVFIKFCIWTIFRFIGMRVPTFHCSYNVSVTHEWSLLCPVI